MLAYVLSELNRRHSYGLDLFLLSIDEGITGYRDDSLETVKRNELQVKPFFFFFFLNLIRSAVSFCLKDSSFFLPVWVASTDSFIQRSVWMDDGRYCEDDWSEEQLHLLWCIPSPGKFDSSLAFSLEMNS